MCVCVYVCSENFTILCIFVSDNRDPFQPEVIVGHGGQYLIHLHVLN